MNELIQKLAYKHFPRKLNVNGPVTWDENELKREDLIRDLTKVSEGISDISQYTLFKQHSGGDGGPG